MKRAKIKILLVAVVFLGLANFFVWRECWDILDKELEVVFFDVGQGDAMFIETPEGQQILIDAGPSQSVILERLSKQMPFWDRTIDLIILTHPDYDHLNGFLSVLDRYKVENILWTGALRETKTFTKWLEAIEKEGANIFTAQRGQTIKAGDALMYVLHPFENLEGQMMEKNSNESSIVSQLVFGNNIFLFTGDISSKEEGELLLRSDSAISLKSTVLKIAHHGSKYSSFRGFIELIDPELAIISCGKDNSYGHPAQQVLSNLEEFAINILRTDENGDIKIIASGSDFLVNY